MANERDDRVVSNVVSNSPSIVNLDRLASAARSGRSKLDRPRRPAERNRGRCELDAASSDEYQTRQREQREGI